MKDQDNNSIDALIEDIINMSGKKISKKKEKNCEDKLKDCQEKCNGK